MLLISKLFASKLDQEVFSKGGGIALGATQYLFFKNVA